MQLSFVAGAHRRRGSWGQALILSCIMKCLQMLSIANATAIEVAKGTLCLEGAAFYLIANYLIKAKEPQTSAQAYKL